MAGHEVRTAPDGAAALKTLDAFVPDVALLDIGLPDLDGYALAGRLRADERTRHARLIAVTGYACDSRRMGSSGFDEHLMKPVDLAVLLQSLQATRDDAPAHAADR